MDSREWKTGGLAANGGLAEGAATWSLLSRPVTDLFRLLHADERLVHFENCCTWLRCMISSWLILVGGGGPLHPARHPPPSQESPARLFVSPLPLSAPK